MSISISALRVLTFCLLCVMAGAGGVRGWPQAPGHGTAPGMEYGVLNLPRANCRGLMAIGLRANGFAVDAQSDTTFLAHNGAATVAITCYQQGKSAERRLMVLAASTNPGTAEWFKDDIRARLSQAASGQPMIGSGNGVPTSGSAVALQIGEFGEQAKLGDAMGSGYDGLGLLNLKPRSHDVNDVAAANSSVVALVEGVEGIGSGGNDLTNMTVIVVSTDGVTAEYYRNEIRRRMQASRSL